MDRDRRARSGADVIGLSPQGLKIAARKKMRHPAAAKRSALARPMSELPPRTRSDLRCLVLRWSDHMPSRSDRREAIRSARADLPPDLAKTLKIRISGFEGGARLARVLGEIDAAARPP